MECHSFSPTNLTFLLQACKLFCKTKDMFKSFSFNCFRKRLLGGFVFVKNAVANVNAKFLSVYERLFWKYHKNTYLCSPFASLVLSSG